jgi:hypothetical protein
VFDYKHFIYTLVKLTIKTNNYIRVCLFVVCMTDIIIKREIKSALIKYHTHTLVVLNLFRSFVLRRHFDNFFVL